MASGINRAILHVDDDPQFSRLVSHTLQRRGYDVVSINDPQEVIPELIRNGYQMVLLDIDMPGINGLELLERIKQYDGGIQVIMLTGLVTLSNAMAAFRRGAEACFFKPTVDFDELCGAVDVTFHKIDHWWQALHNLTKQRRADAQQNRSSETPATV